MKPKSEGSPSLLAALRGRESTLRELLARLGTGDRSTLLLERAWERCHVAPGEIEGWVVNIPTRPASERAEARALLQSLVALHAIAAQEIAAERTRVAGLLDCTRRARARLASFASDATVGESCDVAG